MLFKIAAESLRGKMCNGCNGCQVYIFMIIIKNVIVYIAYGKLIFFLNKVCIICFIQHTKIFYPGYKAEKIHEYAENRLIF